FSLFQHRQRLGKSAEAASLLGRLAPEAHRLWPVFRAAIVKSEEFELFLEPPIIKLFDSDTRRFVQSLALVRQQAVVSDLLCQHMLKPICGLRHNSNLLDQSLLPEAVQAKT